MNGEGIKKKKRRNISRNISITIPLTRKDRIKKEKKGEREKRNAQATEIFSIPLSKTNNTTVGPWLYVARWNGNDPSEWRPRLPW